MSKMTYPKDVQTVAEFHYKSSLAAATDPRRTRFAPAIDPVSMELVLKPVSIETPKAAWTPAVTAGLLTVLAYAITLKADFIFDDVPVITGDTRMHSVRQWPLIWRTGYWVDSVDNLYRPLTSQTYAIQWRLAGDSPWSYHLVNILLAGAVAALVAEFARRLSGRKVAWIAGLLFAVHPVHAEVVAGVVGRAEELCALFMFLALVLFLHRPMTPWRAVAIGACSIASALSKEQGMLTPLVILALALCTSRRAREPREKTSLQLLVLFLTWPLAGLILYRESNPLLKFEWDASFLSDTANPLVHSGAIDHLLMVFVLFGHYMALLVAPLRLSIDYGLGVLPAAPSRTDPYLFLGVACSIAGVVALVIALRRSRPAFFCLVAALLIYAMISNVFLFGTIFGERLLYLPSAFLLIALAIAVQSISWRVMAPVLAILMALSLVRLETYLVHWNDRQDLYGYCIAAQPRSVKLRVLLAGVLVNRGDYAQAAGTIDAALRAEPDSWEAWDTAGIIARKRNDLPYALLCYKNALKFCPCVPFANEVKDLERQLHASSSAPH